MKNAIFLFLLSFCGNVLLYAQDPAISLRFLFVEKKEAVMLPFSYHTKDGKQLHTVTCNPFVFSEKIALPEKTNLVSLGTEFRDITIPDNLLEALIIVYHYDNHEKYFLLNESLAAFPKQNVRLINLSTKDVIAKVKTRKINLPPFSHIRISTKDKFDLILSTERSGHTIQGFQQQFQIGEYERMSLIIRNPKIQNSPRLQVFKVKEHFSDEE